MPKTEKETIQDLEGYLTSNQLKEDYSLLRSSFEEGHAGLYVHRNKTEVDVRFDELSNKLDFPTTLLDFYKLIVEFIDFIADGHTQVNLDTKLRNHILNEVGIFPIKPSLINERFYVYRDFSEDESIAAGTEVLKINGISVNEIVENLLSFVFIDGFGTERKYKLLEKNFSRLFPFIYGVKSVFDIEYRISGSQKTKEVKLKAITVKKVKEIHEKRFPEDFSDSLYSLTLKPDLKVAVLTIKTFNSGKTMAKFTGIKRYAKEDKFTRFLKKAFRRIEEEKIEKLIIDLRGNSGGRENYGAILYSYLTTCDFQYFDVVSLKKRRYDFFKTTNNNIYKVILGLVRKEKVDNCYKIHNPFFIPPLYKIHKKKENAFTGNVFALIDGGSFSAACEFLTTCHRFQRVKFVGEETRGAYIGNNSGLMVSVCLPHSKLVLRIPLFRFNMPVSQKNNHRGIVPDYVVNPSITDIKEGTDTILEYVLENLI